MIPPREGPIDRRGRRLSRRAFVGGAGVAVLLAPAHLVFVVGVRALAHDYSRRSHWASSSPIPCKSCRRNAWSAARFGTDRSRPGAPWSAIRAAAADRAPETKAAS